MGQALSAGMVGAVTSCWSSVLSLLYRSVQRGEMGRKDAERRLDHLRGLRIHLTLAAIEQML